MAFKLLELLHIIQRSDFVAHQALLRVFLASPSALPFCVMIVVCVGEHRLSSCCSVGLLRLAGRSRSLSPVLAEYPCMTVLKYESRIEDPLNTSCVRVNDCISRMA